MDFGNVRFCYDIGTANGKPFVKGGTKVQIQNDKLKDHIIERPLQMLDLSKWDESDKSNLQDRKLMAMVKSEIDIKLNSFGLKIRRLENDISGLRRKIIKLETKEKK